MHRSGITTFEAKSGYGLTVHDEARALRLAREVTDETTYLGAHVVPAEFDDDPEGYVDLVIGGITNEPLNAQYYSNGNIFRKITHSLRRFIDWYS